MILSEQFIIYITKTQAGLRKTVSAPITHYQDTDANRNNTNSVSIVMETISRPNEKLQASGI